MTSHSLSDIAVVIGAELRGDGSYLISGLADIDNAKASDLTFLSSPKFLSNLASSSAGAVILSEAHAGDCQANKLVVANPYLAYAKVSGLFDARKKNKPGVHPAAVVADSASVSDTAYVGPFCVVEEHAVIGDGVELLANISIGAGALIGNDSLIYPNVTIYHGVSLGERCIIHSNVVIGSDGFGFSPSKAGWQKIYQLGGVILGNDVEVGASSAIDRGALKDTVIESGVKLDNQVHIAHNVMLGEHTAIAGCTGIAGSTTMGKRCTVGGAVAISGHLNIADRTHINGGSIITKSIASEGSVFGSSTPQQEASKWRRASVRFSQLDDLFSRVKKLEKAQEDGQS